MNVMPDVMDVGFKESNIRFELASSVEGIFSVESLIDWLVKGMVNILNVFLAMLAAVHHCCCFRSGCCLPLLTLLAVYVWGVHYNFSCSSIIVGRLLTRHELTKLLTIPTRPPQSSRKVLHRRGELSLAVVTGNCYRPACGGTDFCVMC